MNRSFVKTYFPDQPAIGHHLAFTAWDDKPAVVGILADAREDGLNHEPVPTVYWCSPNANPSPYFLIRTHGDAMMLATALRRKIHQLAPDRSVFDIMPLAEHLSNSPTGAGPFGIRYHAAC